MLIVWPNVAIGKQTPKKSPTFRVGDFYTGRYPIARIN
jgi:hypothetical protein